MVWGRQVSNLGQVTEFTNHSLRPMAQRPDFPHAIHSLSCTGQKKCVSLRAQQLKGLLKNHKSELIDMS